MLAGTGGLDAWILAAGAAHCGMRDINELAERFKEGDDSAMLVHLDVDVIDPSVGKASSFECPGGLFEGGPDELYGGHLGEDGACSFYHCLI